MDEVTAVRARTLDRHTIDRRSLDKVTDVTDEVGLTACSKNLKRIGYAIVEDAVLATLKTSGALLGRTVEGESNKSTKTKIKS